MDLKEIHDRIDDFSEETFPEDVREILHDLVNLNYQHKTVIHDLANEINTLKSGLSETEPIETAMDAWEEEGWIEGGVVLVPNDSKK